MAAIFFAMFPDLDAALGLFMGNLERYHNNLWHGLLVSMTLAAGSAFLLTFVSKINFRTAFTMASCCIASHLIIDLVTHGRGLMLFWPFTEARFSGPLVFSGVPWSFGFSSPLYRTMLIEDQAFAGALLLCCGAMLMFLEKRTAASKKTDDRT